MEVTTTEPVTRILCDVCKKDITNGTRYGAGMDKPGQEWVTCDGGEYRLDEGHSTRLVFDNSKRVGIFGNWEYTQAPKAILNCADIALLRHKHPELFT